MARLFFILAFLSPVISVAQCHSFTVDDLLNVCQFSPQNFDKYIVKKGFAVKRRSVIENEMGYSFFENKRPASADTVSVTRSINLYKKNDTWCISLHTSSFDEYIAGRSRLKKLDFFFDAGSDTSLTAPMLFQKKAITVRASAVREGDGPAYSFLVMKKEIPPPSSLHYAEDLLRFESHEYLVSCYGEKNVKKDTYIFSEKESKKCSILFPNTDEQAVFIWDDETNYRKIAYILISGTISTPD